MWSAGWYYGCGWYGGYPCVNSCSAGCGVTPYYYPCGGGCNACRPIGNCGVIGGGCCGSWGFC